MKCPGQDSRYWKTDAIFEVACPKCGKPVEFFKDDTARKCHACGHRFVNPKMDFGCAAYCEYAEQCLGTLPEEVMAKREDLLKDRVAVEMKRNFKTDFKRIGHAGRVARHAERIGKDIGANPAVVLAAAYLHDIGLPESERKFDKEASGHHEAEGIAVARAILVKLGAPERLIDEVCDIIGHHHHPRADEAANFKAVYDADLIVNMDERLKDHPLESGQLKKWMDEVFLSDAGRRAAEDALMKKE